MATSLPTPFGDLTIVCSAKGVVATVVEDDGDPEAELARIDETLDSMGAAGDATSSRTLARAARREAADYLAGRTRTFSVPPDLTLAPAGASRAMLGIVTKIPYGELWTYGDVAAMAGSPRAARAAGRALSRCPIELFVPCHRVVRAGKSLGGYGRHEDRKRWLLRHEGVIP